MKIDHPTTEMLPQLRQLWQNTFGDSDALLDIFFSTAFSPMRSMCLWAEGQLAAAAYWLDCQVGQQKAAYIYAVATAAPFRMRGFCRTLMKNIHTVLAHQGYSSSLLVPSDSGLRQMYRTMGYADFGGIREFTCHAATPAIPLRQIHKEAFSALRRQYLPENAVLQEGHTLELLDQVAHFYAGTDFLLTVSREESRILEFLGNTERIPGILLSLGMTSAHIRTPGTEAFAMCRTWSHENMPTYLGFALD